MEWGDAYHRLVLPSPFSCKGETLTSSVHLGRLGSGRRKRGLGWAQGQEEGGKMVIHYQSLKEAGLPHQKFKGNQFFPIVMVMNHHC